MDFPRRLVLIACLLAWLPARLDELPYLVAHDGMAVEL